MLLRLVKVQPAPEHGRHASHQRKGDAVRLALPAQLAVERVLHQYRQVLQRDTLSLRPFAQPPVVAGAQFQIIHLRIVMDNLQDMPETVAVNLAGIERLRALEQHVELLVGFVQVPRLFRNRGFERTVERIKLG